MIKYFLVLFISLSLMVIQSCSDASSEQTKLVHVSGSISSNTTWSKDKIYVVDNTVSIEGATLTIEPGTIIKIAKYDGKPIASPFYINEERGSINATGTTVAPIIFTSYSDDSKGGDTDGMTGSPGKGDWGNIFISPSGNTAKSYFAYCDFYYGGYGNYETDAMLCVRADVTVDHCVFAHSIHAGLDVSYVAGSDLDVTVTGNTFYDNTKPMWMNPDFSIDGSNIFYNPDNTAQTNDYNGIWMANSVSLTGNRSWGNNGVPYVFTASYYFVVGNNDDVATTLTVANDTVVKFFSKGTIGGNAGGVILCDHDSIVNLENAFFTSYQDDSHGGDTNMDGTLTTASFGDWEGIQDATQTDVFLSSAGILYDNH